MSMRQSFWVAVAVYALLILIAPLVSFAEDELEGLKKPTGSQAPAIAPATAAPAIPAVPVPTPAPVSGEPQSIPVGVPENQRIHVQTQNDTGDTGPGKPVPGYVKDKRRVFRMFADFDTSMGKFRVKLYHTKAPKTVDNFVELAEGKKIWLNPKTGQKEMNKPFFDGLVFHRVIRGFMIQGGCPKGDGYGNPGFKIDDEFDRELRHNREGILSMANAGPNTGGSQFFITVAATPHLDDKHAVFGEIESGMDVVRKISEAKTNRDDKPLTPITLNSVKIVREYPKK